MSPPFPSRHVTAPPTLGLETRTAFRDEAVRLLDELPENGGTLAIDLARTTKVDSAGLGALMLIQRRAAELKHRVVLKNLKDEFRFLLVLTKMDDLFEIEPAAK
jgi:anti-anti-sigma regulatory factor